MPSKAALTLRCENCGHEWTARNTRGKARQCSKCRSRRIEEVVIQENNSYGNGPPEIEDEEEKDFQPLIENREVQERIKRAQSAFSEGNNTAKWSDNDALSRLAASQKHLLTALHDNGLLNDNDFEWQVAMCPGAGPA